TRTEVRNIVARLDRLNGTVARHEKELREQEVHLASRQSDCPLVDAVKVRIRPLEDFVTSERAAEKTSKTWMDRMWPLIWAAAGMFGFLVLEHAPQLAKALFH